MVIYSDNWSDHVRQIKCFFQIMREAKLTINLIKKASLQSYCEILRPHGRPRASKTLRCKNSNHLKIPHTHLTERTCQISRYGRILQKFFQKSPVLKSPDYEKPFTLIIDSSDVGTSSVLVQEASDGLDHPVSYFSNKFLKYQKNYSVVEKETLGLVLALEHFDVYLGSTPFKIKVYTDHNPLTFLKTMKNKNQRLDGV